MYQNEVSSLNELVTRLRADLERAKETVEEKEVLILTLEHKLEKANLEKDSWKSKHLQVHEEKIVVENTVDAHVTRANKLQKQVSFGQFQGC